MGGEALRLLSANIITAVKEGGHVEARSKMLLGALLAGQAFANAPVAAGHALAHPLGGPFPISPCPHQFPLLPPPLPRAGLPDRGFFLCLLV